MSVVFDASVLVPLIVSEPDTTRARAAFRSADRVVIPDFALVEVTNILWKKGMRRELEPDHVPKLLGEPTRAVDEIAPAATLLARAQRIAFELRHPVYDCVDVALAERLGCTLVTADEELVTRTSGTAWAASLERL